MKPRIGITVFLDSTKPRGIYASLNDSYIRSIAAAGGLPLLVPIIRESADIGSYLETLDGLLLSGGGDLSPLRYGEDPRPGLKLISGERDESEIGLALAARERGLPLLGICRGHQVLNVAFGGSLHQDLATDVPESLDHSPPEDQPMDEARHLVELLRGSRLRSVFGADRIAVNSFHHQAVKRLAPGLRESGRASDGVNEAFEAESGGFLMGLQFHAEALVSRFPTFLGIFREFVREASAYRDIRD